ncbi:MAG TPA: MFS transporter [Patescibacteria group bacterium]|nr:MFS transporter [Patescibacteria group bacterium]
MSATKIKKLFYAYAFFKAFILIYPLYAVMFVDNGLNATQISLLFIVWSAVTFILEVPSGAIADKFSRKYVLMIATLFQVAAFTCWLVKPSFGGFLVGFILWGINSALVSGTEEALAYDELKRANVEKQYTKVTGRMESLDLLGIIGAGFVAAALAHFGYKPLLLLSIGGVLISAGILAFLPKASAIETTGETKYWNYLSEGMQVVVRSRKILFLLIFMGIVTGLGAVDEYYDLLFNELGMSNGMIALWMGVVFSFGAVGSLLADRLEGKRFPLTTGIIVWAGMLLLASLLPAPYSPIAIGLYVGIFYVVKVLFNSYLQHALTDKNRATVTSVGGLLSEVGALISFMVFAVVAGVHNYATAFQVLAVVIVVAGVLYGVLHRRYSVESF